MNGDPTVFVVDDEPAMLAVLQSLLESLKIKVQTYSSAKDFLVYYRPEHPGCLVLDVRMPYISGLQLQEILLERNIRIPVIIITGYGDAATAVRAMKLGAVDFFEKPFNVQNLIERIQDSLVLDVHQRIESEVQQNIMKRLSSLTRREHTVLELVVAGNSNKQIAIELGISIKTVEVHRSRVMDKMLVSSVAELTALHIASGVSQTNHATRFS